MFKYLIVALCMVYAADAGIVNGHTHCNPAGAGTLTQLRVTGCTNTPCILTPDEEHILELDFTARHSSSQLGLTLTATIFGIPVPIVTAALEDSEVVGGRSYTIVYGIVPNGQLSGTNFSLRGELYGQASKVNEICINVPCRIV